MADDDRRRPTGRREDYRNARIAVAGSLTLVLCALLLLDAGLDNYELQTTTLVTLGALIVGLLGLEVKDVLRRD